MDHFTLLPPSLSTVPSSWFNAQHTRYPLTSPLLRSWLDTAITELEAYQQDHLSARAAAARITAPISTSPVPDLGTYADELAGLPQLWQLLVDALIEWPDSQRGRVVALLVVIGEVDAPIHRGEATEEDGETPLRWRGLPYFEAMWRDRFWMAPGQMVRRCGEEEGRKKAREVYLRRMEVEARLVEAGVWRLDRGVRFVISVLEGEVRLDDEQRVARDDAEGEEQLVVDFHVPAVAMWFRWCGMQLWEAVVVRDELRQWERRDVPVVAREFAELRKRWEFWEEKMAEVAASVPDEAVRKAAQEAMVRMQEIEEAAGKA